jgi:hypothetical protein
MVTYLCGATRRHIPLWRGLTGCSSQVSGMTCFPCNDLHSLSLLFSYHAPLLLYTDNSFVAQKRFHFKAFWPRCAGFMEAVQLSWCCRLSEANSFRRLDHFLRNTGKVLRSWSDQFRCNVRSQLAIAPEVVLQLDCARDRRQLAAHEESMCHDLKLKSLGLASLQRTIAHQETRLLWLSEGYAPTRFFHAHANSRWCRNFIHSVQKDGHVFLDKDQKAQLALSFYDILGSPTICSNKIKLYLLGLTWLDLSHLEEEFTEAEV